VIRGEATAQTEIALQEVIAFMRPSGLSVVPVTHVRDTQEVLAAVKRATPPCWVYGNPVVGLSSGYRPAAVNMEEIRAAVLVIADVTDTLHPKPQDLSALSASEQEAVLSRLKKTPCLGMKSGVTKEMVKAQGLCGEVLELIPQNGLGQGYLPTKAAYQWRADRWVGLITRLSSAREISMAKHVGPDSRLHKAKLYSVPSAASSWGYGLYLHPATPVDKTHRAVSLFQSLRNPDTLLRRALDLSDDYHFGVPSEEAIKLMQRQLALSR